MPRELTDIRRDIDELDEFIVRSFFDGFSPDKNSGKTIIKPNEVNQLFSIPLRFSNMTWQLINARMRLSREVGENKKGQGKIVIDETRKQEVIQKAVTYAPEHAHKTIKELYELIHKISVRIQNEIIAQP